MFRTTSDLAEEVEFNGNECNHIIRSLKLLYFRENYVYSHFPVVFLLLWLSGVKLHEIIFRYIGATRITFEHRL